MTKKLLYISIGEINRASSRFRVFWWKDLLETKGYSIKILPFFKKLSNPLPSPLDIIQRRYIIQFEFYRKLKERIDWADVIIVQEALIAQKWIDYIKEKDKKLIFDFSDPVHLNHHISGRFSSLKQWEYKNIILPRFFHTINNSEVIIVENDNLLSLAKDEVEKSVMRGPINTSYFKPADKVNDNKVINIGWTGSPGTLKYIEPIFPALEKIGERHKKIKLTLVGASAGVLINNIEVEVKKWNIETEAAEVADFDIGLFNLSDNEWEHSRGGGKLLVYMASGVPIVSSPVGIGGQVVENNYNGLIAKTIEEWFWALDKLITNTDLRLEFAKNARELAVKNYSHQAYLNEYISFLEN